MPLERYLKSLLVRNVILLFVVKFSGYLIPLVALPYLARVLGPTHFGNYAVTLSFGLLLSVVIEYGFNLSATRDVSRCRTCNADLENITSTVNGAKLVLAILALILAVSVPHCIAFQQNTTITFGSSLGAWLYAVSLGFSPAWYFQGIEKLKIFSLLDISGKLISLAMIFIFITEPQHSSYVLVYLAMGTGFGTIAGVVILYRNVPFTWPNFKVCLSGLRSGLSMFIFRAAISLYTLANVFVLGVFASPVEVAYYAGAEKLVRGISGAIGPISQAVYPRVAMLVHSNRASAEVLLRKTFLIMMTCTFFLTILVTLLSKEIATLFFGSGYGPLAGIISGLVWIIPLIAAGNVLGIQWMLPLRLDSAFNKIVIIVGLFNLFFSIFAVSRWGTNGMIISNVLAEALVVLLITIVLTRKSMFPRLTPK